MIGSTETPAASYRVFASLTLLLYGVTSFSELYESECVDGRSRLIVMISKWKRELIPTHRCGWLRDERRRDPPLSAGAAQTTQTVCGSGLKGRLLAGGR